MRRAGILMILLGGMAAAGERLHLALPTAHWFFATSRDTPWLHGMPGDAGFPWFGWLCVALLVACGISLIVRSFCGGPPNPVTARRWKRFREIRRGYVSYIILVALAGLAALDQAVVGKRALAVEYGGKWTFPAFLDHDLKGRDFGYGGEKADAPVDYRALKKRFAQGGGGRVILPPIPYDPTGDTLSPRSSALVARDGLYYEEGAAEPFSGLAARLYDVDKAKIHIRYRLRGGRFDGPADGWGPDGKVVYHADYAQGKLMHEHYTGDGTKEAFLGRDTGEPRVIYYHPAPPMPAAGNWLGTTSDGCDVLAYLYGGLQINFKAALIFVPVIYLLGLTIGMAMGYYGGWFDLVVQRLIEVFSNMPFLYIVIIFSSVVDERFKGLPVILTILVLFGWMGLTYLMRTAAYRERERDYIAAARVIGAGTPRILFRHLLPNSVAILVTLVPFTVSGLIFSLTSLDYLGFGLLPEYASWGRLMHDGLSNLSSPWLVTSAFVVLVATLILITFIGEAVREAFDPKKYTYYR